MVFFGPLLAPTLTACERIKFVVLAAVVAALAISASAVAKLRASNRVGPTNASVQEVPAGSWQAVNGGALYEYQTSGDSHFRSIGGGGRTHNRAGEPPA